MHNCKTCNRNKPVDAFYKRTDGNLHNQCKECILKKQKKKRETSKLEQSCFKTCNSCNIVKSLSDYIKIDDDNYHHTCNICVNGTELLCGGCKYVLPLDNFWIRYDTNKPRGECKACVTKSRDEWRVNNEDRYKTQGKEYRSRPEVKTKSSDYQKAYYNKAGVKERKRYLARINEKYKYRHDENFRIKKILRARIFGLTRQIGINNPTSSTDLLGCGVDAFRDWLEYQFDANMTWDNQGSYWHLDHIKPCASFDMSKDEDRKICFNWINYRPLEKIENILKSDHYDDIIAFKAELMLQSFLINNSILDRIR